MSSEEQYLQAAAEVERRKASFYSSAAAVKKRIAPARLKADIQDKVVDGLQKGAARVTTRVSERPVETGAAATAFLIYLNRRPLSALFRRLYVRITNRTPETSETHDG